jgi:hypothetical protein
MEAIPSVTRLPANAFWHQDCRLRIVPNWKWFAKMVCAFQENTMPVLISPAEILAVPARQMMTIVSQ